MPNPGVLIAARFLSLGRCVVALLVMWVLWRIVIIDLLEPAHYYALGQIGDGEPSILEGLQRGQRLIHALTLALLAALAASWMLWAYRANVNLRATGFDSLTYQPSDAVLWWFVPIANLWRPYLYMRELWRASVGADARVWLPLAWWSSWLACWALLGAQILAAVLESSLEHGPAASRVVGWAFAGLSVALVSVLSSAQARALRALDRA